MSDRDHEPPVPLELRVLTGPNLYFSRPTVKLTLDASGVMDADPATVVGWQRALRVRHSAGSNAGHQPAQPPAGHQPAPHAQHAPHAGAVPRTPTVGMADSPARADAAAALAAAIVRRGGGAIGTRIPAVARVGDDRTVVVAFPFRRRGIAERFGDAISVAFEGITRGGVDPQQAISEVGLAMVGADPGETVRPLRPAVPVIAVTGTNGKTTTTRLISHLMQADGRTPGWSSTDGIVIDGVEVESGDWSGPGGAARVLSDPRVDVAVTETARGGILLRGVGTAANDVSVVTNISADHLGLLGVHTIEQLAEVKSVVARITKASGWTVLNADDPLVRQMRSVSRARPWFYSPDPDNPYLDEALEAGGKAITVIDGDIVVLSRGLDPTTVLPVQDVPLTLAGTSRVNVSNTLAATAAALGVGATLEAVRCGLRSFTAGADHNAGRLNVYLLDSLAVVLDLAHNEASLESLLEVTAALRLPGGRFAVVVGTAGDRTDEAIHAMGEMAAAATDEMIIAGRHKYLRGREPGTMEELWRSGAAEAGVLNVVDTPDELSALIQLLDAALPDGSAIAVCALEQRAEMATEILRRGGSEASADQIAERVAAQRSGSGTSSQIVPE
ncbi:Mur ligase family protein [Nakamurella sp. UYEF19]|uniref:Mur ligase family protein n=1 Tax=Nakamurella sp. UYEF19 TaxID=1756392 RepID=UPI003396A079